jgi:Cof subfamily protein (haloacid dehalogenase superfamily)
MSAIKLVALDLDGTLFNNESRISPGNIKAIQEVVSRNVEIVISTGRPFNGLPLEQIKGTGIRYAITTNGSGIYEIPTGKCLYENSMEPSLVLPIIRYLLSKDIHMDAFINGDSISPTKCLEVAQKLPAPASIKKYILETRRRIDDLPAYIEENQLSVMKMTLNFYRDENGILVDRAEVNEYLSSNPNIVCVCGGYNNLEFTKTGVDKGTGLCALAGLLSIPMECTMAIGDTENDLAILKAAHLGIAMGNATDAVKAAADDITLSNEEDGVAAALAKKILI